MYMTAVTEIAVCVTAVHWTTMYMIKVGGTAVCVAAVRWTEGRVVAVLVTGVRVTLPLALLYPKQILQLYGRTLSMTGLHFSTEHT